jgi:Do/DeqQ family serine protease
MNKERFRQVFRMSAKPAALAGVLLLSGVLVGWTAAGARLDAASGATMAPAPAPAPAVSTASQPSGVPMRAPDSYADIVAKVAPAVVTIRAERVVRETANPFTEDPFFQQFFGRQGHNFNVKPQPREEGALGSGVIVSPDGYILTNAHVVEGATKISVELTDRRTFVAKVIGTDKPSDLAVLKIDANGLHSLPMGDTRQVRVGDVVLAIGNPLGVGQTVTMGIISAKGRATDTGDGSFEDFLQTDAPINQGNSGGALVNTRGELVGINSQILSPSGGSIGIGFAIPSNMAENVMTQLIKTGTVRRARMGVTVQTVNSELAQSLGLRDVRGAIVSSVDPDSPAQKAGIERGDVITMFNGQPVSDNNELRNRVADSQPGTRATVTLVRNGHEMTKTVDLGQLTPTRASFNGNEQASSGGQYGLTLEPVTPDVANQMGLKVKRGLVVDEVAPTSAASDAGLQSGDVILEVNHRPVTSVDQFREAAGASSGRPALLLVNRQGSDLFLALATNKG